MIRLILIAALFTGCGDWAADDDVYFNYFTGESCSPDPLTFIPISARNNDKSNGNVSPTGIPGDNMDDTRSGKVDCYYDGNSGQGDDWKYPECNADDFPQPGCDEDGCCEDCDDPEEEPQDPPEEDPPQDPPQEDPPEEDPPPSEDPV
jgi:hypothetical protein